MSLIGFKKMNNMSKVNALLRGIEVKAVVLKTATGDDLNFFERTEGEISIRDKATDKNGQLADGEYAMASGETFIFEKGVLLKIVESENVLAKGFRLMNSSAEIDLKPLYFKNNHKGTANLKDAVYVTFENREVYAYFIEKLPTTMVNGKRCFKMREVRALLNPKRKLPELNLD